MSQQQSNFDPWTNSNQSLWGGGNALAVARARADVLVRAAFIIRAGAFLDKAISAPATPVRRFLIEVARSRLAKRMATTSTVTFTPALSPWISIILWLSHFVLCLKTQTVLYRTTILIQIFLNFDFTLLCFDFIGRARIWCIYFL